MRYNDDVSAGDVVRVFLLLAGGFALLAVAHMLRRPGLALALLGVYIVARLGHAWWQRRAR